MVPFEIRVIFTIFANLCLKNVVHATCPILKLRTRSYDSFDWNSKSFYHLYQFKAVDRIVKSPFFGLEGDLTHTRLLNRQVKNRCILRKLVTKEYNWVDLVEIHNETNKLNLKYREANNEYFCDPKFQMNDIFLVDFQSNYFISF